VYLGTHLTLERQAAVKVLHSHVESEPDLLARFQREAKAVTGLSPQLEDVINKALAKDPNERYQSAGELAKAFHEAIGMNDEAATITTPQLQTVNLDTAPKKKAPARGPVLIGAAIFLCICLGAVALGAAGYSAASFIPQFNNAAQSTPTNEAYPPTTEVATIGILRFQNNTTLMDKVTISALLDLPPENMLYEARLIDDDGESSRSIGVLERSGQGQYTQTYVNAQGQNLLSQYNRMEITLEPKPRR